MKSICKREGCTCEVTARGLCNAHYCQWRRKTVKSTGELLGRGFAEELLVDAMPGTYIELTTKLEMRYSGVRRAINRMCENKLAHVQELKEPDRPGGRFIKIFAAGPGPDATMTKRERRQHRLNYMREWRKKQRDSSAPLPAMDPMTAALCRPTIEKEARHG